jgi:hypothetical protein
MSKRYRIHPDDTWHPMDVSYSYFAPYGISIEYRDVQETYSDGHTVTWSDGARRVKAPGKRTRVFIGEMAWADAERLAGDYLNEFRRAS